MTELLDVRERRTVNGYRDDDVKEQFKKYICSDYSYKKII